MEMQGTRSEWKDYAGKVPEPRPGTVNTHTHRVKYGKDSPLFVKAPGSLRKGLIQSQREKMGAAIKGCERQPQG